jgi:formate-dependent nitrite reductase membrane component NrfD
MEASMLNEFTVDFRTTEEELDFMVALSMSTEGVGAALFLISFLAGSLGVALVGLALVCVGATALFTHLGHPLRFWRVISKTHATWISRGALFTGGLIGFGVLTLILPEGNALGMLCQIFSLLCALVVMLYTGFLFSSMHAIPFWNTPLLPMLFLAHSVASAGVVLLGLLPLSGQKLADCPRDVSAVLALLFFSLLLSWLYTKSAAPSEAARESVRLLTEGGLRSLFLLGGGAVGLAAPIVLVVLAYSISADMGVLSGLFVFVALLLRIAGDISFRRALLRAGVYAPVI